MVKLVLADVDTTTVMNTNMNIITITNMVNHALVDMITVTSITTTTNMVRPVDAAAVMIMDTSMVTNTNMNTIMSTTTTTSMVSPAPAVAVMITVTNMVIITMITVHMFLQQHPKHHVSFM